MAQAEFTHVPVMLEEAVEALQVRAEGTYLDGTLGRGGHARQVLARLGEGGRILLMDRDPVAIEVAQRMFAADPRVRIRQASFAGMAQWQEVKGGLEGLLQDHGVSSPHLEVATRGSSYQAEGALDMRMDPGSGSSAAEWLAAASESEIADVLWRFGEERLSRRIARAIVERRMQQVLQTTTQLAELVARTIGFRERHKHPATRTFQALRIHLNNELGELEAGLAAATENLKPGGRLVVISFHSLEDRLVKRFMRGQDSQPRSQRNRPPAEAKPAPLEVIGKRFASDAELDANPRSRSAVMRVAEKRP